MNKTTVGVVSVSGLVILGALGFLLKGNSGSTVPAAEDDVVIRAMEKSKIQKKRPKVDVRHWADKLNPTKIIEEDGKRVAVPDDELAEKYVKFLDQIQAAVDAEDLARLLEVISRLQASEEWPDGIPSALHMAAIEALSDFGLEAVPKLAGYLQSGDEEVRQEALDALEESVDDDEKSDYEKAEMIKLLANSIEDADFLESLFDLLDGDFRNSVQRDVMLSVLQNGTPEAKKVMLEENLPGLIDNEDITTVDEAIKAVNEWYQLHPDEELGTPEEIEEEFGGSKPDPSDAVDDVDQLNNDA